MAKLSVAIVTPSRQLVRAEVDQVTAPSMSGQVGILPEHRPLLAVLEEGPVELRTGASVDRYAISGGFLEVDRNNVTLLAETAEGAGEIDTQRAQQALGDAEAQLKKLDPTSEAFAEQQKRVKRARTRLDIAAH